MLKGLAIARTQAEEEARRVFKEREKKLWAVSLRTKFNTGSG